MRELISQALQERFRELCGKRVAQLAPERFGAQSAFVIRMREQLLNASPADFKRDSAAALPGNPDGWMESKSDCLSALRTLCLNQKLELQPASSPPADTFIKLLDECRLDPARRFHLLLERYSCPLNIVLPTEQEIREYLLGRLMVQDRALVEKDALPAVNHDDLLLKLNLLAVAAALLPDLRFLDALNYYYELFCAEWIPRGQHGWLLVGYYGLYVRALAAWI